MRAEKTNVTLSPGLGEIKIRIADCGGNAGQTSILRSGLRCVHQQAQVICMHGYEAGEQTAVATSSGFDRVGPALTAGSALLALRGISKDFGAVRALTGVDLSIQPGETVGLMGDNGAGKSTLVKIIAGNFAPSHGEIIFDGGPVHFQRPVDARAVGIEVVYQDLALADNLTAAANVFLGRELVRKVGPLRFLDHAAMNARAADLFRELKSETRADEVVRAMSGGQRQAVAIARTRLSNAKLVLMDEPTAAISVRQVAEVLDLIRRLKDAGVAVILISHRMPDVFATCDRVMVMRRGRKVADKPTRTTSPEEVTALITGALEAG
jgi:simple sugar transport system ATP-binding protein